MIEQTTRRFDPRALVWFAWAIVMCSMAAAVEAPPAPAPAAVDDGPGLITLLLETLLPAVIGIVTYILHRKGKYKGLVAEVIEALDTGRHVAYVELVKGIKAGREDGKLTDDEKKQARNHAFEAAIKELKPAGVALLRSWGKPKIEKLLSGLVEKAKGSVAKRLGGGS